MFGLSKKLSIIFFLLLVFCPYLVAKADPVGNSTVADNAFGYFFGGAQKTAEGMGYTANTTSGTTLLLSKITILISLILSFVGVVFLILIIYGGITWMTASGNDKQVEKAKNIISRAAIGLTVVILAYAITSFVINRI